MKTICLLYTTYHSYVFEIMQEKLILKNLLVLNFSSRALKFDDQRIKIIERKNVFKLTFLLKCLWIAAYSKLFKYDLIIPHPDHLLGNILFFGNKVKNITLLEDGILNYYRYIKSGEIEKKALLRKKLLMFTPFKYNLYEGHHSGIESMPPGKINGVFSDPSSIYHAELFNKIIKIDFSSNSNAKEKKQPYVIFLDQPIEIFLSANTSKKLRKSASAYIRENFNEVLYKSHPQHKQTPYDFGIKTTILDNNSIPIEELIYQLNPMAVVSFCSTALVTISMISNDIECISIGINEMIPSAPTLTTVKKLFELHHVKLV